MCVYTIIKILILFDTVPQFSLQYRLLKNVLDGTHRKLLSDYISSIALQEVKSMIQYSFFITAKTMDLMFKLHYNING